MNDTTAPGLPLAAPLYKEMKRRLTDALTRGEWKPGEAIPAERRLSERFGISVGTVRKAIDELVAENILIRQQGRGTFVASHNRDRRLFYFFHVVAGTGPEAVSRRASSRRSRAARPIATAAEALDIAAGRPRVPDPQPAAARRSARSSSTTSRCRRRASRD